jgi:hypothetical protein
MDGVIRILDPSGRTVLSKTSMNADRALLDVSELSQGIYQVMIDQANSMPLVRPLIVVH